MKKLNITKKNLAISGGIILVTISSIFGIIDLYKRAVARIDRFAVERVASKEVLKGQFVTKEVKVEYVVDPEKAAEAVSNAAKEGATQGANQAIEKSLK